MRRKLKLTLVAFLAFTSGMLTHSKIYKPQIASAEKRERVVKVGQASWYSKQSPGIRRHTANNEVFDDRAHTCAMWDVPFNQQIKVTNRANGKSTIVQVNDRGPHQRFVQHGRIVDLTKQAFAEIGILKEGLINVELEMLENDSSI